jgi:AraC family transcriptional regulator
VRAGECSVKPEQHTLFLMTYNTQNDAIDEFSSGIRFGAGPRNAPTATVIPRGERLRAHYRENGETEYVAVYLGDDVFDELLAGFDQPARQFEILPTARSRNPLLLGAGMRLKQELSRGDAFAKSSIELTCQELGLHLLRFHSNFRVDPSTTQHHPTDARISRAREFIHASLDRAISLEDVAREAGMSRYHFARRFHEILGDPPHRYILKQRIELAKTLLREPATSIAEVALQCGFADQSHFGRRFRALTGVTPRCYRESVG